MKLQELADLAGVSPATVSRVFSHHPNVKREVRERVLALARKHRYHRASPRGSATSCSSSPGTRSIRFATVSKW